MLVLSRKRGETIVIGNGITVKVLAVNGDRVKLGVVAPWKCQSIGKRFTKESETVPSPFALPSVRRT